MALEPNCSACEDLRQTSADFTVNGLSEEMCASLGNNTGLSTRDDHDTCEDLNNLNDCLVGNMTKEVAAYPICDWKKFMKNFIPNLWTTLKAIICAFCGIWAAIKRLECLVEYMFEGASFQFGETTQGKSSRVYAGKGVDFGIRKAGQQHTYDVTILYVAGGLARLFGSLRLFTESYKDVDGNTQDGNSVWNMNSDMPHGGERLFELRIKKSEYPQIKRFFNGDAFSSAGNGTFYQCYIEYFDEGEWAYGQHGWCKSDGTAYTSADGGSYDNTYSPGHQVPDGYMYVQLRLGYKGTLSPYTVKDGSGSNKSGLDLTPAGFLGIRMNQGNIECD